MALSPDWFTSVRGCAVSDIISRYDLGTFALPFHFEMLTDKKRVGAFAEAISQSVTPNDVVLDIGTGSGILALLASQTAKRVYAIELDHSLARIAATNFRRSKNRSKITLIVGDASELNIPEQVDVIVSEMMDTVLLNEPQVPVVNSARKAMLKPTGKIIPGYVKNYVALASCKFSFYDAVEIKVSHWERPDLERSSIASEEAEYFVADFSQEVPEQVDVEVQVRATRPSTVNAIQMRSVVGLTDKLVLDSCPTLNLPIIVPLTDGKERLVEKGETVKLHLRYRHFANFNNVQAAIVDN